MDLTRAGSRERACCAVVPHSQSLHALYLHDTNSERVLLNTANHAARSSMLPPLHRKRLFMLAYLLFSPRLSQLVLWGVSERRYPDGRDL